MLGAGGMGEVYRATDTRLGRDVALKVLLEAFARDPERLARLEREARVLALLNHPNIAAIYGFEQSEGVPFLVLERLGPYDIDGDDPAYAKLLRIGGILDRWNEGLRKPSAVTWLRSDARGDGLRKSRRNNAA